MKNLIILFAIVAMFTACNSTPSTEEATTTDSLTTTVDTVKVDSVKVKADTIVVKK